MYQVVIERYCLIDLVVFNLTYVYLQLALDHISDKEDSRAGDWRRNAFLGTVVTASDLVRCQDQAKGMSPFCLLSSTFLDTYVQQGLTDRTSQQQLDPKVSFFLYEKEHS